MSDKLPIIASFTTARLLIAAALLACLTASEAQAIDYVTFRKPSGETQELVGRIEVKAQDGGLLVLTRDGVLWPVEPDQLVNQRSDETPFTPLSADEAGKRLQAELPGFKLHHTTNYVVCYNTSKAYAVWCAALLERLHFAFRNYWDKRGFKLAEREFPLVALVFADQASYAAYAKAELGDRAGGIIGYYSFRNNRVTMYDLTGAEQFRARAEQRTTAAQINQLLSQPAGERIVATVIHEATHQLAFNSGLAKRYADVPLWHSEGLAIFFETPDLGSSKGWRTIGAVNTVRLTRFKDYLTRRPADSLASLVTNDARFRDPQQAEDAYAEAWALNYFLIRTQQKQYNEYLRSLSEKPQMVWDKPDQRLTEFRAAFGENLGKLDAEFVKYISALR